MNKLIFVTNNNALFSFLDS